MTMLLVVSFSSLAADDGESFSLALAVAVPTGSAARTFSPGEPAFCIPAWGYNVARIASVVGYPGAAVSAKSFAIMSASSFSLEMVELPIL